MMKRRDVLKVAAAAPVAIAAPVVLPAMAGVANAFVNPDWLWAIGPDVTVNAGTNPSNPAHWTRVVWSPVTPLPLGISLDAATSTAWNFPKATAGGLYSLMVQVGWEDKPGLSTHRKIIRLVQDGFVAASRDDFNAGDSLGFPISQQVVLQPGVAAAASGSSTLVVEVFQNSGVALKCKADGLQSPSFMLARMSDF